MLSYQGPGSNDRASLIGQEQTGPSSQEYSLQCIRYSSYSGYYFRLLLVRAAVLQRYLFLTVELNIYVIQSAQSGEYLLLHHLHSSLDFLTMSYFRRNFCSTHGTLCFLCLRSAHHAILHFSSCCRHFERLGLRTLRGTC